MLLASPSLHLHRRDCCWFCFQHFIWIARIWSYVFLWTIATIGFVPHKSNLCSNMKIWFSHWGSKHGMVWILIHHQMFLNSWFSIMLTNYLGPLAPHLDPFGTCHGCSAPQKKHKNQVVHCYHHTNSRSVIVTNPYLTVVQQLESKTWNHVYSSCYIVVIA